MVPANVDGFPETLANGRGILVPAEDPKALAVALERVLAGRLRPDTAAARVWARQFDAERVATIYEQTSQDLRLAVPSEPPGERGGVSLSLDRP